ncbi:MAG: hypothetical protein ABI119_06005 [Gemmatimonadaceae bacterium]
MPGLELNAYADRVKETTTTTGTGTLTLAGAAAGFQSFTNGVATGSLVTFCTEDGTNWEIAEGIFTATGTTLTRVTILASSNSGSAVSWSAGTKNVFLTLAARDIPVSSGIIYGQSGSGSCLAATCDRTADITLATGTVTSGTIRLQSIQLPAGLPVTNIAFCSGTTAGATLTHQWFVLTDSALKVLCVTGDDTTTAWAASTVKTLAVTSGPYRTLYTGLYYVGIMVSATTVPTIQGSPSTLTVGFRNTAPKSSGNSSTGQTTPATVGATLTALTTQANCHYAEIS